MLNGKAVLIAVTGSIAAYKTAYLIRSLIKNGSSVRVIMTPSSKEFIGAATLATLSQNEVYTGFYKNESSGEWNNHVDLGLWADIFLVAPATAKTIAKLKQGISDDFLSATYLSARCDTIIAPAMDLDMWQHEQTQNNITSLQERGDRVIEPNTGALASGLEGKGRMAEPEDIVDYLDDYFQRKDRLKGKRFLITAGPTYERLDPVRFIGNFSSGKMGLALAKALADNGADVDLVCGPTALEVKHPKINRIDVESAQEMMVAVQSRYKNADVAICNAAVSDYKPIDQQSEKIKKNDDKITIELIKNPDILKYLGEQRESGQMIIGFALETEQGIKNAINKRELKKADYIVLNHPNNENTGFQYDTNQVTLIDYNNKTIKFELMNKRKIADQLIEYWFDKEWS